ncbi:hypothetical protein HW115_07310 [Verrucomicrobiaceae bacterium N1E253]|uniref:SLA1 homology domain-containing protein n=1 Tax=Oceaniferula marina TaxID=2748318 RepID=A0A851GMS7_9BACT|nr:SHD1 domain-containing protein [Oceaniferula marina]NWK55414.1 hypothetical protein [Oceaniferula marina]
MKRHFGILVGFLLAWGSLAWSEPTEVRTWTALSGHSLEAECLKVEGGKAVFKKGNGKTVAVPLSKLIQDDQDFLAEHFQSNESGETQVVDAPDAGTPADDLPYPLGKTTAEIPCDGDFSYFLYLPKSLVKGKKYPVLYIMSPGGGGGGTAKRYVAGAERNGWILAVSKQSKNGFNKSSDAITNMMDHVQASLPIDKERVYVTGFSGGSRMAYLISQRRKEVTGVIACGAGGKIGSRKQVVYGLCGSNCFNRTDMANAFKGVSHKGAVLRYFPGRHAWANGELCEDAITHLNGVFLSDNKSDYAEDYERYRHALGELIEGSRENNPLRAYMWADFAHEYDFDDPRAKKAYDDLGSDEMNKLYVEGLAGIRKFAEKTFGQISASQWKADPKVSSACERESRKYEGTPWAEVLMKMSEDAQKF